MAQLRQSQQKPQLRVAILMIGNMRSFNITYTNLESSILKKYDCDIYVTTYDKRFNFKSQSNQQEEQMTEAKVRDIYGARTKSVTIVNQDAFIEPYWRIPGKFYACNDALDRLFTIQKLAMLAYDVFRGECTRNNRIYDIIIKMRPDILMRDQIILNFSMNDNQIIIPANDSGGGFNDHIAYGKPRVMARYLSYYKFFNEVDRSEIDGQCDVSWIESGVRKNLVLARIDIIREPIRYEILRDVKPQKVVYTGKGAFYVKKYC